MKKQILILITLILIIFLIPFKSYSQINYKPKILLYDNAKEILSIPFESGFLYSVSYEGIELDTKFSQRRQSLKYIPIENIDLIKLSPPPSNGLFGILVGGGLGYLIGMGLYDPNAFLDATPIFTTAIGLYIGTLIGFKKIKIPINRRMDQPTKIKLEKYIVKKENIGL